MKAFLEDAKYEARCLALDLADCLKSKCDDQEYKLLQAAINRHATLGRHLRSALTVASRRRCVLSMMYPQSLGGGHGPDSSP